MLTPLHGVVVDENAAATPAQIKSFLRALFARCLNVSAEQLEDDSSFFSLGLTSLIHHEVMNALARVASELSSTVLFEHPNIQLLAEHLASSAPAPTAAQLQRALRQLFDETGVV